MGNAVEMMAGFRRGGKERDAGEKQKEELKGKPSHSLFLFFFLLPSRSPFPSIAMRSLFSRGEFEKLGGAVQLLDRLLLSCSLKLRLCMFSIIRAVMNLRLGEILKSDERGITRLIPFERRPRLFSARSFFFLLIIFNQAFFNMS